MKTQKFSVAEIKRKLSKSEMKNIMAGSDDTGSGVNCISCNIDSECSRGHICRSSISCNMGIGKVCALPYIC
jgi:hypothetical protein